MLSASIWIIHRTTGVGLAQRVFLAMEPGAQILMSVTWLILVMLLSLATTPFLDSGVAHVLLVIQAVKDLLELVLTLPQGMK